jgi:hypothetical protein
MSHAVAWLCRAAACRFVLGQVRVGVLHPLVPVESVDGRGVARVPCPACGRVRTWLPAPIASKQRSSDRNVQVAALCERVSGP